MSRSTITAALLALLALAPAGARAGVPGADRIVPAGPPCVRPVVSTRAACTFNVWGHVQDPDGVVLDAVVGDGARTTRSDALGFFDLYLPGPGSYLIWVESRPGCRAPLRVEVDAASALREGGVRRDVTLPCTRPSYNAFGFAVVQSGALVTIARSGVSHVDVQAAPGRINWFEMRDGARRRPRSLVRTGLDDRNAAGGLTRSGALMVFSAQLDGAANRWAGMRYVRAARDGTVTGEIPVGRLLAYSPYGPLVILPSGRLMQTFYGTDGRTWRIYTSFSGDDGRTWSPITPVDGAPPYRANEAAAVYVDGRSDATARLLMVARADGWTGGRHWYGLVQYQSFDGGRSWRRQGLIDATRSSREAIPWIAGLSGGRVALVWADRGTMTLKRSLARASDAWAMNWRPGSVMYRSKVRSSPRPDIGDFGYPSIASYGSGDARKVVVFNDVDPAGSIGRLADVDLYALPLWASPETRPVTLSP